MQNVKRSKQWSLVIGVVFLLFILAGCQSVAQGPAATPNNTSQIQQDQSGDESGTTDDVVQVGQRCSARDEVAAYLNAFQELPPNFITKSQAQRLGWDNAAGNLWEVTDQMSIGGDRFGNREGLLPKAEGRQYYECDINYRGGYRGAERIVYSNDGLIFYSNDHYKTFSKLY